MLVVRLIVPFLSVDAPIFGPGRNSCQSLFRSRPNFSEEKSSAQDDFLGGQNLATSDGLDEVDAGARRLEDFAAAHIIYAELGRDLGAVARQAHREGPRTRRIGHGR